MEDVVLPIRMILINQNLPEGTPAYKQWEFSDFRDPEEFLDI